MNVFTSSFGYFYFLTWDKMFDMDICKHSRGLFIILMMQAPLKRR
jgi:hypothetical protein